MTENSKPATQAELDKARRSAETAAARLAELERQEAEKEAQRAAQRLKAEKEAAVRFLEDRRDIEARLRGEVITPEQKAEAFKAGTLASLVAEYLARRQAVSVLRTHAQHCAMLLGLNPYELGIDEVRWVDPQEELRRWQADAMPVVLRERAESLAAEALTAYGVE